MTRFREAKQALLAPGSSPCLSRPVPGRESPEADGESETRGEGDCEPSAAVASTSRNSHREHARWEGVERKTRAAEVDVPAWN